MSDETNENAFEMHCHAIATTRYDFMNEVFISLYFISVCRLSTEKVTIVFPRVLLKLHEISADEVNARIKRRHVANDLYLSSVCWSTTQANESVFSERKTANTKCILVLLVVLPSLVLPMQLYIVIFHLFQRQQDASYTLSTM